MIMYLKYTHTDTVNTHVAHVVCLAHLYDSCVTLVHRIKVYAAMHEVAQSSLVCLCFVCEETSLLLTTTTTITTTTTSSSSTTTTANCY